MSQNGRLNPDELAPILQGQLAKEAAAGFNAMNVEARKRGLELHPTGSMSSYRTYDQQVYLYNEYQAGRGALAAQPGTSNHGWGLAVDFPTQQMRSMVDAIGAQFGYSKSWSDAPSEWWHIKYQSGHYSGPDPGPQGTGAAAPGAPPPPPEDTVSIKTVVNEDGRLEVFVRKSSGEVVHTWQVAPNAGWAGSAPGKNASWYSLMSPGPGGELDAVVKPKAGIELFARNSDGTVMHAYQTAPNAGWAGSEPGKTAGWWSLGNPGA
jgi:D-alanyl-D-alanine carboxypeptidase